MDETSHLKPTQSGIKMLSYNSSLSNTSKRSLLWGAPIFICSSVIFAGLIAIINSLPFWISLLIVACSPMITGGLSVTYGLLHHIVKAVLDV